MMSKKEKILGQFMSDLNEKVTEFFNSKTTYRGYHILNSSVSKGSSFERLKLCENMRFHSYYSFPLEDIILGDIDKFKVDVVLNVGAVKTINSKDGVLNIWSMQGFDLSPTLDVEYDHEEEKIVIKSLSAY